jgi:hypothetical protein
MSDDERFQIIGKVVSDHEAAKKHLATLKVKAKALSEFLYIVGSALAGEATWSVAGTTFTVKRFNAGGPVTGEWPTAGSLAALLQEITDTHSQITLLEKQRKDLGISS